jgi:tetratricopeptide (TPR) repeat protein
LEFFPSYPLPWFFAGIAYSQEKEYEKAISYLEYYIDTKNPYSHSVWLQLGRKYSVIGSYEKALRAFDYAVLINENSIVSYLEKARTLERLKRYKEAIDNYKVSFRKGKPTSFSLLRVGRCYEKLSMNLSALQYYKRAVQDDPLLDKAWIAIAEIHLKNGNNAKVALAAIKKALEVDQLNPYYWKQYATANLNSNMYEEAVLGFSKCLDLKEHKLDVYLGLFDVLFILGDYKDALSTLQDARTNFPDSAEIEYRLSGIHFMLNEKKIGKEILEHALTLDFEKKYILSLLFPKVYNSSRIQKLINELKKGF